MNFIYFNSIAKIGDEIGTDDLTVSMTLNIIKAYSLREGGRKPRDNIAAKNIVCRRCRRIALDHYSVFYLKYPVSYNDIMRRTTSNVHSQDIKVAFYKVSYCYIIRGVNCPYYLAGRIGSCKNIIIDNVPSNIPSSLWHTAHYLKSTTFMRRREEVFRNGVKIRENYIYLTSLKPEFF